MLCIRPLFFQHAPAVFYVSGVEKLIRKSPRKAPGMTMLRPLCMWYGCLRFTVSKRPASRQIRRRSIRPSFRCRVEQSEVPKRSHCLHPFCKKKIDNSCNHYGKDLSRSHHLPVIASSSHQTVVVSLFVIYLRCLSRSSSRVRMGRVIWPPVLHKTCQSVTL